MNKLFTPESLVLPIVSTEGQHRLQNFPLGYIGDRDDYTVIHNRVALNPYNKPGSDVYDADAALWAFRERVKPSDTPAWVGGALHMLALLDPNLKFTTLEQKTLREISGDTTSNRGVTLPVDVDKVSSSSSYDAYRFRINTIFTYYSFTGSIMLSGTDYYADAAVKAPNGGGALILTPKQ